MRTVLLALCLLSFWVVPVCFAGKDMYVQCDDLEATYVLIFPSPNGQEGDAQYSVVFEAKEDSLTRLVDTMHDNFKNKVIFDVYVDGKIAEHYYQYPNVDFIPPLVYTPFFMMIDAGKSRDEALALARRYCPSTLPDAKVLRTYSEHMTNQNDWVREDRKRSDAARLRARQNPQPSAP